MFYHMQIRTVALKYFKNQWRINSYFRFGILFIGWLILWQCKLQLLQAEQQILSFMNVSSKLFKK